MPLRPEGFGTQADYERWKKEHMEGIREEFKDVQPVETLTGSGLSTMWVEEGGEILALPPQPDPHLTCNQLMLLLAWYRGSEDFHPTYGTTVADEKHLRNLGYLEGYDTVTELGKQRVLKALD